MVLGEQCFFFEHVKLKFETVDNLKVKGKSTHRSEWNIVCVNTVK